MRLSPACPARVFCLAVRAVCTCPNVNRGMMKIFVILVAVAMAGSLAACGGGSGGGFVVVEEFSDCPLCKAAKDGDLERVLFLLDSGENPNSISSSANAFSDQSGKLGDSALRFAVAVEHADIVRALLDGGADVNKANKNGATPLSASTYHSSGEIAMILLDAGANLNAANENGWTALMYVADKGKSEVAKVLLDAGANPNAADTEGWTALMWAAHRGHSEVAKALLDAGANPNAKEKDSGTALIFAAHRGYSKVAKMLLNAGANLNAKEKDGWTAVNIAAAEGHAEVAKILLECGASPDIRNNEDTNAWHWANRQPIMHAIFYKHLAEVKAGKDIKPCLQKEVAAAPPPPKGENIAEKVFENAWRSVVVVKSGGRQGSGVIVRPNAVATNCHVIDGGDIVVHKTGDRRALTDSAFAASVRRRDTERDFCLLDVAGLWGIPAGIRAYGSLKVGEDVYALGAPQGLDLSLSAGVISQLRQGRAVRYIQTDAAISPGSSGGGLFDSNANLIGILTAKIASENVEGIGFAIPADLATTP